MAESNSEGPRQPGQTVSSAANLGETFDCETQWLRSDAHLQVHVCFRMLFAFAQQQRNKAENDRLSVTYCITGFATDADGNRVSVGIELSVEQPCSIGQSCYEPGVGASRLVDLNT